MATRLARLDEKAADLSKSATPWRHTWLSRRRLLKPLPSPPKPRE